MTISGERTEQLYIFCRVTGFTSDFLSFIDVELIRFFYGALQLITAVNGLVCDRLTAAWSKYAGGCCYLVYSMYSIVCADEEKPAKKEKREEKPIKPRSTQKHKIHSANSMWPVP